eukprot:XP_019076564.1 PREDICTED: uncharacterized protein LOC100258450 [Vitis vinifera]
MERSAFNGETSLIFFCVRLLESLSVNKINSIEHLVQIEGSLRESLDQVQTHKENIEKQQLTPLECYSQMGCIYPLEWVLTSSFNPYHGLLIMTVNKWFYPRNQTGFPKGRGLPCRFLLWKLFWVLWNRKKIRD